MTAIDVIKQIESKGYRLKMEGSRLQVLGGPGAYPPDSELVSLLIRYKPEILRIFEQNAFLNALKRLELGETDLVRVFSRTCNGELIITRSEEIPDSIAVDCPHFTYAEIRRLLSADSETVRSVYKLKQTFPSAKVTNYENTASTMAPEGRLAS